MTPNYGKRAKKKKKGGKGMPFSDGACIVYQPPRDAHLL